MQTIKTALAVFVGVLAALLCYDLITAYRLRNPQLFQRLGLSVDIVRADYDAPEPRRGHLDRLRLESRPPDQAGYIEWTDKPNSRQTVPR